MKEYSVGNQSLGTFESLLGQKAQEMKLNLPQQQALPSVPASSEKSVVKISDIGVGFEVKKLTDEEIAAYAAAGKQFLQDVQELAKQELDIEVQLPRLKAANPKWARLLEDDPIKVEIMRLQDRLKVLRALDPKQREKIEDAKLHEEVVRTQRLQSARAMMNRLMDGGFYRMATYDEVQAAKETKKWPDNTQFFEGKAAFPCEKAGKTSGYLKALHAEVRKMTQRVISNEIARMKAKGNSDLSGLRDLQVGAYCVSYEAGEDKSGKKRGPGFALIEVCFRNREKSLKVEVAIGDCRWWEAENGRLEFIPIEWFEKGRVLNRKMIRDEYDERQIEAMLRALMYQCRKRVEDKHLDQLVNTACGVGSSTGPAKIIEAPLLVSEEPEKAPVPEPESPPKGKKTKKSASSK